MATEARVDIASRRNEARTITIRFVGVDWQNATFRQQVRLGPDTPGAPMLNFGTVTNPNAEGFRVAGVAVENGKPVTTVRLRYNLTTMRDLIPYSGEMGDDARYAHAIQVDGVTRLAGDWWAIGSVIDSDAAPVNRPFGYGTATRAPGVASAIGLTFAGEDVIEVTIDGIDQLAPLVAQVAADAASAAGAVAGASAAAITATDAAVQASALKQAILQAVAGLPAGTQLPLQAVSRTVLASLPLAALTAGLQVYLSEEGRGGLFVWQAFNVATSVAADPSRALWIAPDAAPTGASGAWKRQFPDSIYRGEWWGAIGDGDDDRNGTDNTAAVQAAINAVAALGGGTLEYRPGHYCIKGAQTNPAGASSPSQIFLPSLAPGAAFNPNVIIRGANRPGSYQVSDAFATIFHCTLQTTGGAMFGSRSQTGAENGALVTVYMENIDLRGVRNPGVMLVDARFIPSFHMNHYRCTTEHLELPFVEPTKDVPAIRGPQNDVPLWNSFRDGVHVGFYTGLEPGELFHIDDVSFSYVKWALTLVENRHSGVIGRVVCTALDNGIRVLGRLEVSIEMWNTEHASRPHWGGVFGYDVYDPNGYMRSSPKRAAHFHCHDGAELSSGTILAKNFNWTYSRNPTGSPIAEVYPGFAASTTASSVDEVLVTPGAVGARSDILVQATGVPQGTVASSWVVSNVAGPAGDYRIGTIEVQFGTGLRSGQIALRSCFDGALNPPAILVDEKNNILVGYLKAATDNAGAAAMGVPLAGVYITPDGFLKARFA